MKDEEPSEPRASPLPCVYGIGGILHDKLVIAFQHALRMFGRRTSSRLSMPHPPKLYNHRSYWRDRNQRPAPVRRPLRLQTSQTYVKDVVSGIFSLHHKAILAAEVA